MHVLPAGFLSSLILSLVIILPEEILNDFALYFFLFGLSPTSEPED